MKETFFFVVYGTHLISGQEMAICIIEAEDSSDACCKADDLLDFLDNFDYDDLTAEETDIPVPNDTDPHYWVLTSEVEVR